MKLLKIYINSYKGLSAESWMLALVMLINRSGSMVLPFLGVYMTDHLNFDIKDAGLVLSFFGIGSVVGSWVGGMITDKIGEFKVQSLSLFLSVPMFCLIPLFDTEVGLAAIIFIQSSISEAFRPANSVAITKYAKPGNITRAFSLNRMAVNLGFSIGPALGGILAAISYDFLFYSNAVGALLAGLTYVLFFRKREYRNPDQPKNSVDVKSVSPYKDYRFLIFCVACFMFSICFFQLLNTLTIFYKQEAHLSQKNIGFLLGFSGIVVVLLEMLLVQIAEKYFKLKYTLFLGTFLCGISFAMLAIDSSMWFLVVSITILSIGEIWALPFMATVTALRSGTHNKGVYMGILGMAFSLSFIITPFLGTLIAENFGFTILWIGTGILLTLTALGFYYIIPWMLKEKEVKL
ncbi:Multidrug resistance protein MdtH [Chryseobacterium aquaeductus]|uniref:Multidrug resistance protein MdtH n=1 Tax=Chryseobacterium aquaeductus TaxID=2675056 RepID=A0A9N8MH91_9FLAO|nr:MFS transporter [Chryseobacterium aquaeductus]CAA7331744.1 Multidrug resistance protein MdtH [Chryseobacterium potabilaquae]CAD7812070.1 Multidrug resistance protein MdtH [Chryseobacterium aquaeductus]